MRAVSQLCCCDLRTLQLRELWRLHSPPPATYYAESAWPKRIHCGQGEKAAENGRNTGCPTGEIGPRFWPVTQANENVSGGPVCARVHE